MKHKRPAFKMEGQHTHEENVTDLVCIGGLNHEEKD